MYGDFAFCRLEGLQQAATPGAARLAPRLGRSQRFASEDSISFKFSPEWRKTIRRWNSLVSESEKVSVSGDPGVYTYCNGTSCQSSDLSVR